MVGASVRSKVAAACVAGPLELLVALRLVLLFLFALVGRAAGAAAPADAVVLLGLAEALGRRAAGCGTSRLSMAASARSACARLTPPNMYRRSLCKARDMEKRFSGAEPVGASSSQVFLAGG